MENTKPKNFEVFPPLHGKELAFSNHLHVSWSCSLGPGSFEMDPDWEEQEVAELLRLLRRGPSPARLGLPLVPVTTAAGICVSIRVILEIM